MPYGKPRFESDRRPDCSTRLLLFPHRRNYIYSQGDRFHTRQGCFTTLKEGTVMIPPCIGGKKLMETGSQAFHSCGRLILHIPAGSAAEQYAKEENLPFRTVRLDDRNESRVLHAAGYGGVQYTAILLPALPFGSIPV